MNAYKKSITIFGIAIPLFITLIFAVVCLVMSGNYVTESKAKEAAFSQHNMLVQQLNAIQSGSFQKQRALDSWDTVLASDIRPVLQSNLKSTVAQFNSRQLNQTKFSRPLSPGKLASGAQQNASSVNLTFRGNYLPMQQALLEIESRLPQMQLDTLTVSRERDASQLNFDLSYTIWEKQQR